MLGRAVCIRRQGRADDGNHVDVNASRWARCSGRRTETWSWDHCHGQGKCKLTFTGELAMLCDAFVLPHQHVGPDMIRCPVQRRSIAVNMYVGANKVEAGS